MSIKVIYFPARGRAEATRLALAFTGTAFEDIRLPGPELFAAYKEKAPFGQFPLLEVDGKMLAQSGSQLRYVARNCGGGVLCPTDAFEAAVAGSICDQMSDVGGAIYGALYGSGSDEAAKAKAVEELKTVKLPKMLGGVVAYLADKKFFGGDKPNMADFAVFSVVESAEKYGLDLSAAYPTLVKQAAAVRDLPELAAYFAKRAELEATA
jgi:glutathione S-transferase